MAEKELKEKTIRLGELERLLQRAEYIEENERLVDLSLDDQTNIITLFVEEAKHG